MTRTVEVYTGAYASGKSEISINRALALKEVSEEITLVDLDTVEPAYTLRPIQKDIEKHGVRVVTQEDYFGLGETGNTITNFQLNCLSIKGNIVIDVGYGVGGLDILDIINGIDNEENLNIYIVINTSKFETSSVDNIVEYVNWSKGTEEKNWKKFTGIISNSHFSDETQLDDVLKGYEKTKQAAKELNLPIRAICMTEKLFEEYGKTEHDGVEIWTLQRFMPKALW